jgi:putative MATE family efflux protein
MHRIIRRLKEDMNPQFLRAFLTLALPIVVQNLVSSSLYIVDNLMIGSLGEKELAAVAQANQLSMIVNIFIFGIASGSAIFGAQFWGKKDLKGIGSVLTLSTLSAILMGAVGSAVALFFPRQFLSLYLHDEAVIDLGVQYLQIVFPSYMILGVTNAVASVNKSTERVRLPMIASVLSLTINTTLNYCLIFGKFGFPRLGLRGGAIASLTACSTECLILVLFTFLMRYPAGNVRNLRFPKWAFVRHFFKTTVPVILNEGLWGVGTTVFSMVYGAMGTQAVAAMSIAGTLDRFLYIFTVGIVHATSILVGRTIGEGNEAEAFRCARRAITFCTGVAVVSGVVIALMRVPVISLFSVTEDTARSAANVVLIMALILPLRSFNYINVVGILRSGGDTVFSMALDLTSIWTCSVPLVALTGLVLHWPIEAVVPFVYAEDIPKIIIGLKRFLSRKWIRNIVREHET